jgi:hypothetical protein
MYLILNNTKNIEKSLFQCKIPLIFAHESKEIFYRKVFVIKNIIVHLQNIMLDKQIKYKKT